MKITQRIIIDKPLAEVWDVLAVQFDKADEWMATVYKSSIIETGTTVDGAPMYGRVCELTPEGKSGLMADEEITNFDHVNHTFTMRAIPVNASAGFPVVKNDVDISVKRITDKKSHVIWESKPDLKTLGKVLSPVLKVGLNKAF
jgi:hypothetical protein